MVCFLFVQLTELVTIYQIFMPFCNKARKMIPMLTAIFVSKRIPSCGINVNVCLAHVKYHKVLNGQPGQNAIPQSCPHP